MYCISFIFIQAIISSPFLQFCVKLNKTERETIISFIQPRTAVKLCKIAINLISLRYNCRCHRALREKTVDDFMRRRICVTRHRMRKKRKRENNSRECNAVFHGRAITVFLRANSRGPRSAPNNGVIILPRIFARRAKSLDVSRSTDDNATICHTSSIVGWHAAVLTKACRSLTAISDIGPLTDWFDLVLMFRSSVCAINHPYYNAEKSLDWNWVIESTERALSLAYAYLLFALVVYIYWR